MPAARREDSPMKTDLAKVKPGEIEHRAPDVSVGAMLHTIIEKGISGENVGALEKIVELYERMEAKNAEKEFAAAFVALQAAMPKVQATKPVPNNDGTTRYTFAPYEEIMAQVGPMLKAHGFTVTFSTDYIPGPPQRLVKICTLQHVGGHARTNSFAVRVGSGPPKASEAQADGAASTYAKRFALCDALNITVGGIDNDARSDDARAEGDFITEAQAIRLEERVEQLKVDRKRFLAYAGAATFAEIRASKHDLLVKMLDKKADENVPV